MSDNSYRHPPSGWTGMQSPRNGQTPTFGASPPLPPRPVGGSSNLAARSSLSFPPPPRSPNRPPELPPRPQQGPSQMYGQPAYGQPMFRRPVYGYPLKTGSVNLQSVPPTQPYSQPVPQPTYTQPQPQQNAQPSFQSFHMNTIPPTGVPQYNYFPQEYPPPAPLPSASSTYAFCPAQSATDTGTFVPSPPPLQPAQSEYYLPRQSPTLQAPSDELSSHSTGNVESLFQSLSLTGDYGSSTLPAELSSDTQPGGVEKQASRKVQTHPSENMPAHVEPPSFFVAPQAASQNRAAIQPVRSCIDSPMNFPTTWYAHDQAPEALICSRCYINSIWPTRFRDEFKGAFYSDGAFRLCRFKKQRITEQLLKVAVTSGQLQSMLDFMNKRQHIPDCKGTGGSEASEGIKWFRTRNDAVPGLIACEACYEDVVLASPLALNFEAAPEQKSPDVWACDMCIPFVNREFVERSKTADWPGFVAEAKTRMDIPVCLKETRVLNTMRKWFVPINGPPDVTLCAACYCDRVLKSGDEGLWESNPSKIPSLAVCCSSNFHIDMAMSVAEDMKDRNIFWRAISQLSCQPFCDPSGIKGQTRWFTFASRPPRFVVCGCCYAGLFETLGIAHLFVPVADPPAPDVAWLCSMNKTSVRFPAYISKMLQTWFTGDASAWEDFVNKYAAVRTCPLIGDCQDGVWYGWKDCCICEECYMDFAKGTTLDSAEAMPLRGVTLDGPRICEMYSPRMRGLYQAACELTPPDPAELLAFAGQRRLVYMQTVLVCRSILAEQSIQLNQSDHLRFQSIVYTSMGNRQSLLQRSDRMYGIKGFGYGYKNQNLLQGAIYNAEANQISSQIGGDKMMLVSQLEGQWKMVE